jgi:hypothetical protein
MRGIRQCLGDVARHIRQTDTEASPDKASTVVQAQVHLRIDGQMDGKSGRHLAGPSPITFSSAVALTFQSDKRSDQRLFIP